MITGGVIGAGILLYLILRKPQRQALDTNIENLDSIHKDKEVPLRHKPFEIQIKHLKEELSNLKSEVEIVNDR